MYSTVTMSSLPMRAASNRDQRIEDPRHVEALVTYKRAGRAHRAMDRLHHAAASASALFKLAAERGAHLSALTRRLIDSHGAAALETAIAAALREQAAHLGAVPHFIDQAARPARSVSAHCYHAAERSTGALTHRASAFALRLPTTPAGERP